jgi:6-pyruvoyltetrahydropterin/6-carboxytetrahydropterin synthase
MVVNLYDLKEVLLEVLNEFDHKHLNLDTSYFTSRIPTTENIAGVLWTLLARRREIGRLELVRLYEDEDLYADVTADDFERGELRRARVVRRYPFAAAHRIPGRPAPPDVKGGMRCEPGTLHGHNFVLDVAVAGELNAETGMIIDLERLDRTVRETVLTRVADHDLSDIASDPTGERVARWVWSTLVPILDRRLDRVRVTESADAYYEMTAR